MCCRCPLDRVVVAGQPQIKVPRSGSVIYFRTRARVYVTDYGLLCITLKRAAVYYSSETPTVPPRNHLYFILYKKPGETTYLSPGRGGDIVSRESAMLLRHAAVRGASFRGAGGAIKAGTRNPFCEVSRQPTLDRAFIFLKTFRNSSVPGTHYVLHTVPLYIRCQSLILFPRARAPRLLSSLARRFNCLPLNNVGHGVTTCVWVAWPRRYLCTQKEERMVSHRMPQQPWFLYYCK